MEHLSLEPLVHAVPGPLRIGVEVEIPVLDSRHMHAVAVQLDHVQMIAAVLVAFLILDDYEERLRGYGVGSVHGGAKIANNRTVLIAHEAIVFQEYLVKDRAVIGYLVVFHIDKYGLPNESAPLGPVGVRYHSHAFPVSPLGEFHRWLKI